MADFSEKVTEITGQETQSELLAKLKENFDMLQRFMDGITGQRLEDWSAVLRDGSIRMSGDLKVDGSITMGADDENVTSLRRGVDGVLEHRDGANSEFTPIYEPQFRDVTSERSLDYVYKNGKKRKLCQITVKLTT